MRASYSVKSQSIICSVRRISGTTCVMGQLRQSRRYSLPYGPLSMFT
ncbi:hypothetical protein [Selenomonas sp.]|nr:hypothetical protein [Selenomonas sp.]MDY4415728.1 hypothetical protein [Selenomonas sp.]